MAQRLGPVAVRIAQRRRLASASRCGNAAAAGEDFETFVAASVSVGELLTRRALEAELDLVDFARGNRDPPPLPPEAERLCPVSRTANDDDWLIRRRHPLADCADGASSSQVLQCGGQLNKANPS